MQTTRAQLEFDQDYFIIRERVVFGKNANIKAIKLWIRVYGKKTRKKAIQEVKDFYEKYRHQMKQPSGFELQEIRFWKDSDDDD